MTRAGVERTAAERPTGRRRAAFEEQPRGQHRPTYRPDDLMLIEEQRPSKIRLVIVDDHKLFAQAIGAALKTQGMEILTIAGNGAEAVQAVRAHAPDLVLMDIGLPDGDGITIGAALMREHPGIKVVALTARNDGRTVKDALRAGFHGFLTKDTPLTAFASSLQAAMDGQVVLPQRLAGSAAGLRSAEAEDAHLRAQHLTGRERQVLALLVEGASSEDISGRLSVSPHTVRTHVQNILTKLQVRSRLEAATFAVRYAIVDLPGER